MTLSQFLIIGIFVVATLSHLMLLHSGTQIGRKGRAQSFANHIFGIVDGILTFVVTRLLVETDTVSGILWVSALVLIGIVLIVGGILGIYTLGKEKQSDIVKETLWQVKITPTGYRNRARLLQGITADGQVRNFILRGADRNFANQLKKSGVSRVAVIYHTSSRRIEALYPE